MRATMRVAREFLSIIKAKGVRARRFALTCLVLALFACAVHSETDQVVRFLRFADVEETLELFADAGLSTVEVKLQENRQRLVAEQRVYQENLKASEAASDATAELLARGTLYQDRGLSADTSLLPNYALEDTLKTMLRKGTIQPGSVHRILVIGPGLDFADKRDGYDFYPVQTIQPFAMLEAVA